MTKQPLARARELMRQEGVGALIVQDPSYRRWLTGYNSFYQGAYVVVTQSGAHVVTYGFGADQARQECRGGIRVSAYGNDGVAAVLAAVLQKAQVDTVGVDSDVSATTVLPLVARGFVLQPVPGMLGRARTVRQGAELEQFRAVGRLHDRALEYVEGFLAPGRTETQVRAAIDGFLLENGAEGFTFETVVLAGENGALPHLRPSSRALRDGDLVLVDFGAVMNNADADVCRTYVVGDPTAEQAETYAVVRKAQEAAIAACVPGATGARVHEVARRVLESRGLAELFTHSLGHGLSGGPRLAPGSKDVLVPGAIVAVEPGVYRAGWGGMRVEDTVLVTAHGPEKLTGFGGERLVVV